MNRVIPGFIRDGDLWILSSRCVKIGVALDWKNGAEFVTNCCHVFRAMECGRLLNRSISFSSTRENQVYASDKWYLIKLYCANNDHNAFGSTSPDFYSSILDNWYFRGHERRYLCAIEPCKIPLSSCLRIIDRNLDIHPNKTDSSRMKSVN